MTTNLSSAPGPGKLARNSLAGVGATAVYLVSRLFLTPFVLMYLTLAEFGLWSMCFVILSYASIGAFGVNNTYIRYTAGYHAAGRQDAINGLLSTGLICMSGFCLVFLLLLAGLLPLILDAFDVSADLRDVAGFMILGTALIFGVDLTLGAFRSILEGIHEIALVKKIYTLASLVEIGAIIGFLLMGLGVRGMLYAYVVRVCLDTGICVVRAFGLLPGLRVHPRGVDKTHFSHLFVFGGKVQVLGGLAIFLSSLDRVVISSIMGLSAAGIFEIARKFPFTGKSISGSAFGPFLPAAAHVGATWERDEIRPRVDRARTYLYVTLWAGAVALVPLPLVFRQFSGSPVVALALTAGGLALVVGAGVLLARHFSTHDRLLPGPLLELFLNGSRHINILNAVLFCFLMAVSGPLILAWAGPGYEAAVPVLPLLAAAYMIHQCTGPASLIFRGIDRTGRELEYLLVQLVLALAWIPAATEMAGLPGTGWAILASTTTASLFLFWRSNQAFAIPLGTFVRRTVMPGIIPALVAVGLYLGLLFVPVAGRMTAVVVVLVAGVLYLGLALPLIWRFVLDAGEKDKVRSLMPGRLARKTSE